jgi:putative lipase involved disintegration of autophagic bodies
VAVPDRVIHHGISRKVKHISVIVCVSAAGESLTPYRITSQDFAPLREQLKKHGVSFRTGSALESNTEVYLNAKIFIDEIQTVWLSNLAELRMLDEFAAGWSCYSWVIV